MNSIKCPHCGLTNWATDENCKRCKQGLHVAAAPSTGSYSNDPYAQQQQYAPQGYGAQQQHYQPQVYGAAPYQHGYQPNRNLKQGLAITSMVMGIVSIPSMALLVGLLLAPLAFVLGIVGVVKANRKPYEYGGKGFAIAGIAVSSFGMFIFIPIIAAIAIPNLLIARKAANEASAIRALSTIAAAQTTYKSTTGQDSCGDMQKLSSAGLVPANLAKGEYNGYRFNVVFVDAFSCEMHATPVSSSTGNRSFMASSYDGEIHVSEKKGAPASRTDPLLNADSGYKTVSDRY